MTSKSIHLRPDFQPWCPVDILEKEDRDAVFAKAGTRQLPIVFVDDKYMGDYDAMVRLNEAGQLDKVLQTMRHAPLLGQSHEAKGWAVKTGSEAKAETKAGGAGAAPGLARATSTPPAKAAAAAGAGAGSGAGAKTAAAASLSSAPPTGATTAAATAAPAKAAATPAAAAAAPSAPSRSAPAKPTAAAGGAAADGTCPGCGKAGQTSKFCSDCGAPMAKSPAAGGAAPAKSAPAKRW